MAKDQHHLGGHYNLTHIDEGALVYLKHKFGIKNMLDIGCGPGDMADIAKKHGITWTGIDGDETIKRSGKITHDYTTSSCLNLKDAYELGWSTEFLEHVQEEFIGNFLSDFTRCKFVLVTAAPPGKKGYHHVNCQNTDYWIKKFRKVGLIFNKEITESIRKSSTMKREFMRNTGMFYENCN